LPVKNGYVINIQAMSCNTWSCVTRTIYFNIVS